MFILKKIDDHGMKDGITILDIVCSDSPTQLEELIPTLINEYKSYMNDRKNHIELLKNKNVDLVSFDTQMKDLYLKYPNLKRFNLGDTLYNNHFTQTSFKIVEVPSL